MNKQNIPAVPDENRMEELLEKIQPVPSENFHQKMEQAAWRVDREQRVGLINVRWKIACAIVTLAVLIAFFITPQGRALAQEVIQFFSRINAQAIEIPESQSKLLEESANISYDLPLVPLFIPTVSPEMAACQDVELRRKLNPMAVGLL